MNQSQFVIEEVSDPLEIARFRAQMAQADRNIDWLQSHWPDLLPRALGQFVAVAGQEAFIAETAAEARARAGAAHPDDKGLIVQYVLPRQGPRIYDHRG